MKLEVTAWSGGAAPVYGLRVRREDTGHFRKANGEISLLMPGNTAPITVKITKSFWNKCHELRSRDIKEWLVRMKYIPWPKGFPPKFYMVKESDTEFRLLAP